MLTVGNPVLVVRKAMSSQIISSGVNASLTLGGTILLLFKT